MPFFASVAIPNIPKETLTYAVPPELVPQLFPGMRVAVPLGRRLTTGYVIEMKEDRPAFSVKVLHEILDPAPVFSAEIIRLCSWMSKYYICGLGDALKAALPQGLDVESERYVSLISGDQELIARAVGTSNTKRQIIETLSTGEVISEAMLTARVGLKSISPQLRELMMEGVIQMEAVLDRPQARKKTVKVVRLLPPWTSGGKLHELFEIMEKRSPRQVNLLAVLWAELQRGNTTVPMTELVKQAKATSQQVRSLEEKELVEVLDEEVMREFKSTYEEFSKDFELTPHQRSVLGSITTQLDEGGFLPFLLHGVTASGKTQVYIEAIRHALSQGKTAIVLVPEIGLTPQLVFRFRHAFGKDVTVMHSRMSVGERYDAWRHTLDGRYRIVVGVRSAVFAPLKNVGLIVVDEEQETSYKQSDASPRYNARDVAVMRGFIENAVVVMGSATPSAESYYNAVSGKYRLLNMPERIDSAILPDIIPVDVLEARKQNTLHGLFSRELVDAIRDRMTKKDTCILLHNRRGYAPHIECNECGYVEQCGNCSISLVYHKDSRLLRCHYCGASRRLPVICPQCGGKDLDLEGAGTQRVEEDLRKAIPDVRIIRMDMDTTRRKGAHDLILSAFGEGEADVLLGTQMVAKGLDFENVTLVGVISAEQSLLLPDFRAGERTFQLLTQVSGRSGRGKSKGEVIIQTVKPDHPIFLKVYAHEYVAFIEEEIESRKNLFYPPFSRLVLIMFSGPKEEQASSAAHAYYTELRKYAQYFRLHSPQPALLKKINNRYRFHLLLRVDKKFDPDGSRMSDILRKAEEALLQKTGLKSVRIDIDVDPQNMM